jgi:hypothetical protein
MRWPWSKLEVPAKMLVVFATLLLVAGGLCGLQWLILGGMGGTDYVALVFMFTGILELAAMAISVAGMFLAVLLWGGQALYNRFAGRTKADSGLHTLFGSSERDDDAKH